MAKKIIHQLVDDLDGTVLDAGEGETVHFSLDGVAYEIDLTDENSAALRDAFGSFVAAARRVGRESSTRVTASTRRTGRTDLAAVRAWANSNGYSVSDRGRVPASVLDAYDTAH
ncbi:histone-like nucleoid-structuring protein Lsr2 [Microbacterium nymphoidis]|uniref:histone-like nucleoid-structuring protein Lsr2 n=1 Tax=Microbacterium nymphoidis TaxID=2898586 RepID=UPI001E4790C6|nr:Lsr2 family protein [Microbacterium nymphoidis]MCD2498505.1 Lsr2 family protein [Microbacterium nymphoidis]